MSNDGRSIAFMLDPSHCQIGYMPRYTLIELEDFQRPKSVVDFHLSIRYAAARRMVAPSGAVPPEGAAAMAGPTRQADTAWARRTLLPAVSRLAAYIGGPVFIAAIWSSDANAAPTLRFRFGGPETE